MTEVAREPTARADNPFDYFRYLIAIALIALGGIIAVVWTAFLGWAAGKVFNLW